MRHLPLMPDLGSFVAGTQISTTVGELAVEDIVAGERLLTPGSEIVTVTRVTSRTVRFSRRSAPGKPVLVPAGSLGGGLPSRELILPPHQLVGIGGISPIEPQERIDILIPAASLTTLPGARVMRGRREITLYSIVARPPQLILAEGVATETTRSLGSRVAFTVSRGAVGGRIHCRAGLRVLSEAAGRRLITRLRREGDMPDGPPGNRESDLTQWDLDLALERAAAGARRRKAG